MYGDIMHEHMHLSENGNVYTRSYAFAIIRGEIL